MPVELKVVYLRIEDVFALDTTCEIQQSVEGDSVLCSCVPVEVVRTAALLRHFTAVYLCTAFNVCVGHVPAGLLLSGLPVLPVDATP